MNRWKDLFALEDLGNSIKNDIVCFYDCINIDKCLEIHYLSNFKNYYFLNESNIPIYKDLIDQKLIELVFKHHEYFLIQKYINLYPIITPPDGNCLFHAVLIQIYGIPDINLELKKLILHFMFSAKYFSKIKEYWKYEIIRNYQNLKIELTNNIIETEWNHEMKSIMCNNAQQGCLSIFLLSHIVRRAIIIVSPIENELKGLYLPFLLDLKLYNKNPIFVYYHNSHFTSLMCMKKENNITKFIMSDKPLLVHFYDGIMDDNFLSIWFHKYKEMECEILE